MARGDTLVLGPFGSYGKNDSVDVQYELGDRTMVVTGVDIVAPSSEPKRRLARSPQP